MKRKKIALFTAQPEAAHEKRIIQGTADQCRRYGYHCLVFSPMTHLEFKRSDYVRAESNIYGLANFDEIDGLILDSVNLLPGIKTDLNIDAVFSRADNEMYKVKMLVHKSGT